MPGLTVSSESPSIVATSIDADSIPVSIASSVSWNCFAVSSAGTVSGSPRTCPARSVS